jgi:hypothetical protein
MKIYVANSADKYTLACIKDDGYQGELGDLAEPQFLGVSAEITDKWIEELKIQSILGSCGLLEGMKLEWETVIAEEGLYVTVNGYEVPEGRSAEMDLVVTIIIKGMEVFTV